MQRLGDHPRAGGGKRMTVGNRAAEDVKFALILPVACERPSTSRAKRSLARHWRLASVCAAKASCISISVRSASVRPARSSASVDHAAPAAYPARHRWR
jgi:hypothetical protein